MKHFMKHTFDWELRKWGPFHTHVLYMYILIDCLLECCMHIVTVIWRRRNQTSRGVAGTKRKNRNNVAFWKSDLKKVPLNYAIFFLCIPIGLEITGFVIMSFIEDQWVNLSEHFSPGGVIACIFLTFVVLIFICF